MEVLFPLFILGLFVGSFLNVLIDRLPREEQVFKGRSYCESCKHTLKLHDLIPLFSFIGLSGKCRYCQSPISWYYPIVELTTACVFVFAHMFLVSDLRFMIYDLRFIIMLSYYLFIVSSLVVIFFIDLKYGIIPDTIVFSSVGVSLFYLFINHKSLFINHLFVGFGAFLFFLLIFLITRGRGMGFGDVKFAFLIGLLLGFPKTTLSLYVAFLTGAVVSIILILAGKKKFRGSTVPFGPFLVIGTIVALFWGNILLKIALPFL